MSTQSLSLLGEVMGSQKLPELCLINEDESFIGDHITANLSPNNKFSVSYARSESRQGSILGAVPSPHQEHPSLSSSDGELQTSENESGDDDSSAAFFQNISPTLSTLHPSTRCSETVKRPPLPFSRTLSMPLPSQLSHLQHPHRPERHHSTPLVLSAQSSRVQEVSMELADSIQMVVQTMLQISPPQVLDPAKERFSACSLSIPTSSMSAMFTTIKNINYLSANMLSFCEQPSLLSGPSNEDAATNTTMHNEFDIGEMLQCLGDALSGAAAQVGVDLVLYHGNVDTKHLYVSGDESAISFALSHIVRQVLNTAERGDTVELGLLVKQDAHSSPAAAFPSSKLDFLPIDDVLNTTSPKDNGPLKCTIRISHKYAPSERHQGKNHPRDVVTTEIRPKLAFDTLFLQRILRQIDGELISDLPPPESFTSGRTCDLHIVLQRLPTPSSTPAAELTDEEMEPSLEQLASFGESLKGKRVTLYASADGSFAHHLTVYLTAWGMDVTHVSPEAQVDDLVDPTPEFRSSYNPSLRTCSESGVSSGKADSTQSGSQSPSFIFIDDDIDTLKERLQSLRLNQSPQPAPFGSRKRPSLSAARSSPQIARIMGLNNAHRPPARVVIMHFTSLGNYKLLKDVMQSIMASYASASVIPEVMIIPKPAGPRRFLTALHTAVTKPNVDPFFLPIATSPISPAAPLSTATYFIGSPASEHGTSTFVNSGGSPQALSPSAKHSNRPHSSRTNSDRSTRSGDSVNKSFANILPSPLALPDNIEYFSTTSQRLGSSPSSGLVIQSLDGQPAGIYFHPRSKTSRTTSSQSMERDRGQLSVPTSRRASTSRMASGSQKDNHLIASSSHGIYQALNSMAINENEKSSLSSSPIPPGKQLNTISALSCEIQPQSSPSILSPVPRKPSIVSRKDSSPSISPAEGASGRRGLGKRAPSVESKDSITHPASSKQKGRVPASDTNVVPPISVLIVDDNPINQTILSTFMKRKKIKYDLASNGQEAVQKWRTGGFHLILMDIQMPVMDGIQATKEIRRLEKANAMAGYPPLTPSTDGHTPSDASSAGSVSSSADTRATNSPYRSSVIIVALTASSLQSDRVAALAAGCNDFLTKPVSLLWLNNKIIEWGSIKALQMWADIRPDALKSMTSGQAAQARNIADRLHVPPKGGRRTPSPTLRSTSVLEDSAAALALASSAGTILQRLSGQFSPSSSTVGTPDGRQSVLVDCSHPPVTRSTLDDFSSMPDVLGSASVLSRMSAESADRSDGGNNIDTPKGETQARLSRALQSSQSPLESQSLTPATQSADTTLPEKGKVPAQPNGYIQGDLSASSETIHQTSP